MDFASFNLCFSVHGHVRRCSWVSWLKSPMSMHRGHHGVICTPFSESPLKALLCAVGRRRVISLCLKFRRNVGHLRPPVDQPGLGPVLCVAPSRRLVYRSSLRVIIWRCLNGVFDAFSTSVPCTYRAKLSIPEGSCIACKAWWPLSASLSAAASDFLRSLRSGSGDTRCSRWERVCRTSRNLPRVCIAL